MKTLIAALALAALPNLAMANVKTVAELSLDLDRDGKSDLVRILETPKKGNPGMFARTLEVSLSKSQASRSYPGILADVSYDAEVSCIPDLEVVVAGHTNLKLSASGGSFELKQEVDYGCRVKEESIRVSLSGNRLVVDALEHRYTQLGMGDAGSSTTLEVDFVNGSAKDSSYPRSDDFPNKERKLSRGCKLTLASYAKNGIPACAQ